MGSKDELVIHYLLLFETKIQYLHSMSLQFAIKTRKNPTFVATKIESMQHTEWFPIVNEAGETIGKASRKECHSGSFLLHPVVHLHVFNERQQLYVQKRAANKDIQPNKWDTAVGGHVDYGETVEVALRREAKEELGIHQFEPQFLFQYPFRSAVEYELVNSFWTIYPLPLIPDAAEISEARFWDIEEIRTSLNKGIFTPNFESEFVRLLAHPSIISFLSA